MKRYSIPSALAISLIFIAKVGFSATSATTIPYRQINTGENYIDNQTTTLFPAENYLSWKKGDNLSITDSGDNTLQQALGSDQYGNLNLTKTLNALPNVSSGNGNSYFTNSAGETDKNRVVTHVKLSNGNSSITLPIIINNGLRAKSIGALVHEHINATGRVDGPDYFEVSVKPSQQFTLNLNNYVSDPATNNQGIQFYADSAFQTNQVKQDTYPSQHTYAKNAVAQITQIGQANHGSLKSYGMSLNATTGELTGIIAQTGIYQINCVALIPSHSSSNKAPIEKVYFTFYIDVNNQVDFSQWQQGQMPSNSVIKTVNGSQPLTMMYSYSHADPTKNGSQFDTLYSHYAGDIHYANKVVSYGKGSNAVRMPTNAPINVLALEAAGPTYGYKITSWKLKPLTSHENLKQQIMQSSSTAIQNGLGNPQQWLPPLLSSIKKGAPELAVSPDLTFGQNVRATFPTYSRVQSDVVTQSILKNYIDIDGGTSTSQLLGINLDLEKGTSPQWAPFLKVLSDKLAYQGKFFGYYEFSGKAFQPSVVAAMGPLGVAFISAYDMGSKRAPLSAYEKDGMTAANAELIYNMFHNNQSCNQTFSANPDHEGRYSWCNLSMTDSIAANKAQWTSPSKWHSKLSTEQVFNDFNGNFSIDMPFAESSTDFSVLELFNPNFSPTLSTKGGNVNVVAKQGGLVLTNDGASDGGKSPCSGITNQWLNNNSSNIIQVLTTYKLEKQREKNSSAYADLAKCLFSNVRLRNSALKSDQAGFTPGYIMDCGKDPKTGKIIPLSKCILIRGIPSASGKANSLAYPTPYGYMSQNYKPYLVNGKLNPHMTGYSYFALQSMASEPNNGGDFNNTKGSYNMGIQEPWDVGGFQFNPSDQKHSYSATAAYDPFYYSKWEKIYAGLAWHGAIMLQQQWNSLAPTTASE